MSFAVTVFGVCCRKRPGKNHDAESSSGNFEQAWGLPWRKIDFIKQVLQAGHPKDRRGFLPEPLNIQRITKLKDHEIAKIRSDWFQQWTSRMQALEPQEKKLKDSMHADLRKVVAPKRILIFKEILEDINYEDKDVWKLLAEGVPLEGEIPISGVFAKKFRPAVITPEGLRSMAPVINQANLKAVKLTEDKDLDEQLWEKTKEEIEKGWISSPQCVTKVPFDYPLKICPAPKT